MKPVRTYNAPLVVLLCLSLGLTALASRARADGDDPPSRVARLAYAQGSVSFQPAGTDDWVTATRNRPLTTNDRIWSDRDGRLELQLDQSLLRASNNTGFSFLNLSDTVTQVQLTTGTLLIRVHRLDNGEIYEIDTPNLAFSVLRPGLYRINVNESGDATSIRIRDGEGEVTGGGSAYMVHANDSVIFSGMDRLNARFEAYGNPEDQFESWAAFRDRHNESSEALRYVSADVVGYEDLDDYGSWRRTPEDGYVWFPRPSVADWTPYHYGHWAYIAPWGYTWVDDEPWGFAPFHYGRWVFYEGSWGWVPVPPRAAGAVYVRPVYAPALVAWVGGPHFGISIEAGRENYSPGVNVAWFPLAPREVYLPSYSTTRQYIDNLNTSNTPVSVAVVNNFYNTTVVNNTVNVTSVKYLNETVRGAVTATTPQAFTTAQPVARHAVNVDPRDAMSAPARAFAPAVVPAKQAVLGSGRAVPKPPAALETRAVVAKAAPPPPAPSFERRQEAIRGNGGKPLSAAQARQLEPAAARVSAAVKMAPAAKAATPQPAPNGAPGGNIANGQPVRPPERPPSLNNAVQQPSVNPPVPAPVIHPNDIPVAPRPALPSSSNAALSQKQQQEQDALRTKQEQERLRVQQQQDQQHAKLQQQQADEVRRQQIDQQRQQQQLQQAKLQQQQADEARRQQIEQQHQQLERQQATLSQQQADEARRQQIAQQRQQLEQQQAKLQQQQADEAKRQQIEQQRQQQDQQRAKLQQQQADGARRQQVEQQHQQQTQQLQQKQAAEQKRLDEKQQQERQKQETSQPKGNRPPPKQ
jgi:hypothetical protein